MAPIPISLGEMLLGFGGNLVQGAFGYAGDKAQQSASRYAIDADREARIEERKLIEKELEWKMKRDEEIRAEEAAYMQSLAQRDFGHYLTASASTKQYRDAARALLGWQMGTGYTPVKDTYSSAEFGDSAGTTESDPTT
jgi:hypothetical protein